MQQNILKESNITKIFLLYVDNGSKKKVAVRLKYMDQKICYFSSEHPVNFVKPKNKIPVQIFVYTPDGVYKTEVTLKDTNYSLNEILFELTLPKNWEYSQLRDGMRKQAELPYTIKFNDDFTLSGTTFDISVGGISFYYDSAISSIYKKVSGVLTLEFPQDMIINFPDRKLITEAKFVREIDDNFYGIKYVYKFMSITEDDKSIIKNFLLKLD